MIIRIKLLVRFGKGSLLVKGNMYFKNNGFITGLTYVLNFPTAESAFLFRDRDHPVTGPSLGVLNRPASLSVLERS